MTPVMVRRLNAQATRMHRVRMLKPTSDCSIVA